MFGFTSFAEAPFGSPDPYEIPTFVSATVTGVSSSTNIADVTSTLSAAPTLPEVTATLNTGSLGINLDAKITLSDATSSGAVSALTVNLAANPVIDSATATTTANDLDYNLSASIQLTGVSSSVAFGTAADAYDADANTTLASATATGSVSAIAEIQLTAAPVLPEATATLTAAALEFDADANTDLDSASVSIVLNGVEAKGAADTELSTLQATTQSGDLTTELTAEIALSGVSSTIAFGTAADAYDADANITIPSTSASLAVNDLAEVKGAGSVIIGTITATSETSNISLSVGADVDLNAVNADIVARVVETNAVQFVYDPNDYDRSRVIYLNAQDTNNVVIINPEIQTVYTTNVRSFNTVIIEPENRTIVVDKIPVNSTTVYIAA